MIIGIPGDSQRLFQHTPKGTYQKDPEGIPESFGICSSGVCWGFLDVPLEVRIDGDRINGLFHLPINGIFLGVITH